MRSFSQKLILAFILFALLALLLPAALAAPRALAQLDNVIFVVDPSFPPFARKNAQGELEGFDIDLMTALAGAADLKISMMTTEFRYVLTGVAGRLYDVGGGCIYQNAERAALINFSKSYFATGDVLIVQADNDSIQQVSDLTKDMAVGVIQGSLTEQYARTQITSTVLALSSVTDGLTQLNDGALNAVIADEETLFGYRQTHPDARLKIVGELLTYQECSFVLEKSNTELLVKLNTAMVKLEEEGTYEQIYRKWFGQRPIPTPPPTPTPPPLPTASASSAPVTTVDSGVDLNPVVDNTPIGIYYLRISGVPAANPAAESYQILTLVANGLWFSNEWRADAPNPSAPVQLEGQSVDNTLFNRAPGLWWINEQQQIEATQLLFNPPTAPTGGVEQAAAVLQRRYQMTLGEAGKVSGFYTTATYDGTTLAQSPTATPVVTQTVEFTGWRLQ